ncbi:MAG: cell surface protein [Planctomycetota bacterium]|jgi:DNA-binding beta-propeller fold protein YncE
MVRKTDLRVVRLGVLLVLAWAGTSGAAVYRGPQAIVAAANAEQLYIAFGGADQVAVFDVGTASLDRTIDVPAEPRSLALSGGGRWLYVTCGDTEGRVCIVDVDAGRVVGEIAVGYGPTAAAADSRRNVLYVCNRFDNDVWAIDLAEGRCLGKAEVSREPVAAALTPDGKWLYVGNHLPVGVANVGTVASDVSIINTSTMRVYTSLRLPNGSTSVRGVAASPDGQYVYVSHILARYTVPTTQLDRGWMNTNALSIIDAANRKMVDTVLLDDVDHGAANPWGVACSGDSKTVFVTHAGTDELSIIDVKGMLEKIASHRAKQRGGGGIYLSGGMSYGRRTGSDVPNQLSFLKGVRERIRLRGKGPRALAVLGSKAYVAEYYSDSLSIVDVGKQPVRASAVSLGAKQALTTQRRGEMLFNDASLCFQQWQSCGSCHPDARVDALNWDLLNDGIGNPKNTKSMLLVHRTPPSMITAARPDAESAVRAGFRHILFAGPKEEDATAIDEYLKLLEPAPSPHLVDGKLSAAAERGKAVFERARCTSCHFGELLTDLEKYDVGTGDGREKGIAFDTPSLVEAWRTGPYLYDGRAATIRDVVTTYNSNDDHGTTSDLSEIEINDLVEYILSL